MAHKLEEKVRTADILINEDYTFNSLFLPEKILLGLKGSDFLRPSPIQLKAIPLGRCGLDLIVKAKSGTGKTVVFTVLALECVDVQLPKTQIIIIAPTREIAVQIKEVIELLGKHIDGLIVGCFIGGLSIEEDTARLKLCHIAVGAPGRLKALIEKGILNTKSVRLLVLDEADKLMEECFQADINYIYHNLPQRKQVLAVSATYPDNLDKYLANYMHSPTFVTPDIDSSLLLGLQQFVVVVKEHRNVMQQIDIKSEALVRILSEVAFTQCIVFFNFQTRAETLSHLLKKHGWKALYISGSQAQPERLKVIKSLKKFECRILLTTDLTARGIDASNVNLVINYEVPFKAATYLHRMGRAGRYGSHGLCITISSEGKELQELQKIIGQVGGSESNIPKVPERLGDIWTCSVNNLEKVNGIVGDDNNCDIKNAVADLKSGYSNPQKLKVADKVLLDSDSNEDSAEAPEPVSTQSDSEGISANILYPWIPSETSVLTKPLGKNILDTAEPTNKRNADMELTLSKNIALYNTAELLTTSDLQLKEHLSQSVGDYFTALQKQDERQEKEMEKFFESVSCDEILSNLTKYTEEWSKANNMDCSSVHDVPTSSQIKNSEDKENIFKISYDFMTQNTKHWTEAVSDYCSTDNESETEDSIRESDSCIEVEQEDSFDDTNMEIDNPAIYAWNSSCYSYNYHDVAGFKELYDRCTDDMANYAGRFTDEASANEWYDNWRSKLSSVTNYVQQNIETYEKSCYQNSVYYRNM